MYHELVFFTKKTIHYVGMHRKLACGRSVCIHCNLEVEIANLILVYDIVIIKYSPVSITWKNLEINLSQILVYCSFKGSGLCFPLIWNNLLNI
jgi:hypothetical protein